MSFDTDAQFSYLLDFLVVNRVPSVRTFEIARLLWVPKRSHTLSVSGFVLCLLKISL